MKTKFNLYCVLFIVALVFGFSIDYYQSLPDAEIGFKEGREAAQGSYVHKPEADENLHSAIYATLTTRTFGNAAYADTLYNNVTQSNVPARLTQVVVNMNRKDVKEHCSFALYDIIMTTSTFIYYICCVWFFIQFLLLFRAVKRGEIFEHKIEKWLKRSGILLIIIFICSLAFDLITFYLAKNCLDPTNYEVVFSGDCNMMTLYTGVGMLIFSEILAMGRKMKEEQELTI